jgi:hypothetical protein
MTDRYSIAAGLLLAAVIAVALFSDLGDGGEGTLGIDERPHRWPLPEFAVPVAGGGLEGDANIAQDDCAVSRVPCPEDARRTPACRVSGEEAIRVCDLFDHPSVIAFWFSKGGGSCIDQQDAVDRVYARYRDQVRFLSLNVRDDRDSVRDLIRQRRWRMPVGYDRDGAVAGLYRIVGCPTFAYIYPGGTLQSAGFGALTEAELRGRVEALLRATRKAERSR